MLILKFQLDIGVEMFLISKANFDWLIMQISTELFGRTLGCLWVCIICLCGMNLSGGETALPGDLGRCKTEIKKFNKVAQKGPCGRFIGRVWWPCNQDRNRTKEGTTVQYRIVNACFNSSTTPTDAGDQSDGSGLSGSTGTPILILTTIILVAAICFRKRRQRRKKRARVASSGQLDLYVEPDVIRDRKRAGITRDEHDDSRDQPNSIEFALTNRSPSFTKDGEDDNTTESKTIYHVKEDDSIPVLNHIGKERKIYANQKFQSATNYDHVILSQNDTRNEDVYQNDKEARQSNPDGYDHIMEVKIT